MASENIELLYSMSRSQQRFKILVNVYSGNIIKFFRPLSFLSLTSHWVVQRYDGPCKEICRDISKFFRPLSFLSLTSHWGGTGPEFEVPAKS